MPLAKFLYEEARKMWYASYYPKWEDVVPENKLRWEAYARAVADYFVP